MLLYSINWLCNDYFVCHAIGSSCSAVAVEGELDNYLEI